MGLDELKYKVAGGEMTGDAGEWREWGAVQWLLAFDEPQPHAAALSHGPPAHHWTPCGPTTVDVLR